jgi:Ca2+-transporting ATPase
MEVTFMTEQKNSTMLKGLTSQEAQKLQAKFGKNELTPKKNENFFFKVLHIVCEPMFLLLLLAAIIYFILGEPKDGAVMLIFVVGVISIDVIQEWKTDKTLNALKELSAPHINVIRNGKEVTIQSSDLVPNDLMMISEGIKIPADGEIIRANDLCVDESSLTGESCAVWKVTTENADKENTDYWRKDYCYAGTLVTQGSALINVTKIGSQTEYGKIGTNVATAPETPTPLQKQTNKLVKTCSIIAATFFIIVAVITYFNIPDHIFKDRVIESILSGITLAMAMIPEEFPVVLTVFLSMGAWRLAKKHSLVRKLPSVETLGAVSVLCVDKTGTITMNQMSVCDTWSFNDSNNLVETMGLACETEAYDPMEKAMLTYCEELGITKEHLFSGDLITEYAFTNELKMMGHVWNHDGEIVIAAKGSPERLLTICNLSKENLQHTQDKILEMSQKGLRVIAVGISKVNNKEEIPKTITDCSLNLCGLIGLADPPRESVKEDIKHCLRAGIRVVMITGDNGITASSIAKQIGIPNSNKIITGDELNKLTDEELRERVNDVSIFSRVLPEHKMKIVKAFKERGEIVAMTGDGVNDSPALKYADIGIAMGKRGSEVSREAADLILMDDNFSTIVDTIRDGRRIYDNIRKAIGYIFSIHIPIAFAAILAPFLNINPSDLLLLPIHVVLLELIIDPTCSIILERQPAEENIMDRAPRNSKEKILTKGILFKGIIQGFVIFLASFGTYFVLLSQSPNNAPFARTMGLVIIMLANLLLVQVNSSDHKSIFHSTVQLLKDKVMWTACISTIVGILFILYTPLCDFLKLTPLSLVQIFIAILIAIVSVVWYELVKLICN